jgi:hypothetical protein
VLRSSWCAPQPERQRHEKECKGLLYFFGLILIHAQRQSHIQETFMHLSINFCDGTDIIIRKNTLACFIAKNINEEDRVRSLLRINSCAAVSFGASSPSPVPAG